VTITTENTAAATGASAQVPAPRSPLRTATATARLAPSGGQAVPGGRGRPAGPRVAPAPTSRAALSLLRQATDGLAEAHRTSEPLLRYPAAYLAALRAGAAVLAVRARPQPRRGASRNVWQLLAEIAPEFTEWAAFFASCSDTRAAAEAGIARLVGQREADDLLRQAEQFVGLVTASIPLR
jgi:SAV_6107-like HEPN